MLDIIWNGIKRVAAFLTGEDPASITEEPEILGSGITDRVLSTPLAGSPVDLSRWTVTEHVESPFEKAGRLYLEGDDLVIRSDLDCRGFRVPLVDVVAVLDGELKGVLLLGSEEGAGVVRLSASGKAMNFEINPFLYTAPLTRVMDVLEGRARKAAVFVGREVVGVVI